ncbi:DUF3558 family protein [Amycolatopsis sp.]|uniref:DUF3558 family protein n=1 Tax=Amycolatopsis sp. TaxID=37632 RepID=UPI00262AFDED|nr:DUF3558 family protein [Amycolatopsis sp.]
MLAGCSVAGVPSAVPGSVSTTRASTSNVPSVENPLPAKVLAGSPCDTALTTADLTTLIGTPNPPTPSDNAAGPKCDWNNASGSGAHIGVTYQTKAGGGLSLDCRVFVGIRDDLVFTVGMFISQGAASKGIDACTAGRDVADRVLTNIKART